MQFPTAVTRRAEWGDLPRFANPRPLLSARGLPPREPPRGARRRPGALTKPGTAPARRVLGAGAWAYRSPATVSRPRQLRLEPGPNASQAMSWPAHVRRCQRDRRVGARGQHGNQVVVASARARAAFVWAIAREVEGAH